MKRDRKTLRSKKRYNKFLKRNDLIEVMSLLEKSFAEFATESMKSISRIKVSDVLPNGNYLIDIEGKVKFEPRHIVELSSHPLVGSVYRIGIK